LNGSQITLHSQDRAVAFLVFSACLLFYIAINTAFGFRFGEIEQWPNYNYLTEAFSKGRTYITQSPKEDFIAHGATKYLYYGPLPAILRLPLYWLTGSVIPTGFMIAFFLAGNVAIFFLITQKIKVQDTVLTGALFSGLYALNGISLFIAAIPSIHHEAITGAMFFLMISILIYIRIILSNNSGSSDLILLSLSNGAALACRASYAFAIALISAGLLVHLFRNTARKTFYASMSIYITLSGLFTIPLLLYNQFRFGNPLDFGITRQISMYDHTNFIGYDHIPYHIWSLFFRLPIFKKSFPYFQLPYFDIKADQVGIPPYSFTYSNEMAISIFILLPICLFVLYYLIQIGRSKSSSSNLFVILIGVFVVQVVSLAIGLATAIRMYYDFLGLFLLISFISAEQTSLPTILIFGMTLLSLIISVAVLTANFFTYCSIIEYKTPWLLLFRSY
jgi:hypothetical protein